MVDQVSAGDKPGRFAFRTLGSVGSRESALAVLRLAGAEAYQDWTTMSGRGWDAPLTPMRAHERGAIEKALEPDGWRE